MSNSGVIKIPFKNIGRKKKHKITLFSLGFLADTVDRPGLCLEIVEHAYNQALKYLEAKGFEQPYGYYYLRNGKILKGEEIPYYPLWGAIQERDKEKGQTGIYLAALIIAYGDRFFSAKNDFYRNEKVELHEYIMDQSAMIQALFTKLFLLDNVQSKFSAGRSRNNPENDLTHFKAEAENIFIKLRNQNISKEECYRMIATELRKNYPNQSTPASATIKEWLKA